MGKDVNKKFTVNLEISTKDAEAQVKASAENIKKTLANAMKDGLNTKELRGMAETINSLFTGIGKSAPLDIEKNFKGNGNAAKRIQILTDALNDLSNALGNVNNKGIDVPGLSNRNFSKIIKDKVKEFYDAQIDGADLNKLNAIKQSLKEALSFNDVDFRGIQTVFDQLEVGNIEEDDAVNSIKSIVENLKNVSKEVNSVQANITNNSVVNGFKNITQEAKKTEDTVKKVMYHLGNLFGGGTSKDIFGEMPFNLTEAAAGSAYEKYGFGVLGGGLFGVSDPNTITTSGRKVKGTNFIQSIDLSKYNMYMANTEERAVSLMDFLSKLQKFAMKTAEPNYTGFDEQLQGLDVNSLYQQFQTVFTEVDLTKDKFNEFINQMVDLLKQAGLKFDEDGNYLEFASPGDLYDSENISTRFMKMLGYQGVNVGGTSFDGFGQGSVLFDFNESDIVGFFNTVESAVKDYENIAGQIDGKEWIGTSEQLEQYGHNIDEITTRVKEYINMMTKDNWSQEAIQGANQLVTRLEQVRTNIDNIKSDTGLSDSQFADITSYRDSATSDFQRTGDAAQEAEVKVESFLDLSKELQGRYTFEDVEIGQLLSQLDVAKNELQELANQGVITEQRMREVSNAFDTTTAYLNDRLTANKNDRESEIQYYVDSERQMAERAALNVKDAENRADAAESDSLRYQEAADRLLDEKFNLERENENLREQLAQQKQTEGQNQEELSTLKLENEELREQLSLLDQLKIKATQYSDVRSFMRENVSDLKDAGVKGAKSAKEFWRDANYNREDLQPVAMAMEDVANIIRTKVPDNILDGWFRDADSEYKSKLENLALTDTDLRNAALNVMWENYKQYSGKDIGYDEFLHSDIPVYRGKNSEKYVDGDELLSFTFDKRIAEQFGNHVLEAVIKPIETIGSYQTTGEAEILVRRDQLEAMSSFNTWLSNMSSDLDKSFVQTTSDDKSAIISKENDALQEQLNLEQQIANTETTSSSDVSTIEAENQALKEQVQLKEQVNNSDEVKTKSTKSTITPEQKWDKKFTTDALTKYQGELRSAIKKLDFNPLDANLTSEQQEIVNAYKDIIVQIEKCSNAVKSGEQVELSSIQSTVAALKEKIKVYKEQNNVSDSGKKKDNQKEKNYGSSIEIRETARFNKLNQYATDPLSRYSTSSAFMDAFNDYKNAYDQLIAKKREFEATGNVTKEDEINFKQLTDECTKYAKSLEKAINASEKLEKSGSKATPLGDDFVDDDKGRKAALTSFVKQMHDISAASITFDKNYTQCTYAVKNSDGTFTQTTAKIDAFKKQIVETSGQTKRATTTFESFFDELKNKARSIGTYLISMVGFQEVFQQIRQGITYVKEIDSALTELKKVTNETGAEYDAFLQSMSKTGSVIGATVADLTTMAAEWARLGYSMEEAGQLAESTAILLNVSEFEDATTASEALISTMQAFQYTADESQHVVDILNEVKITCLLIQ